MNNVRIYLGHALTGAPKEFVSRMLLLRNSIKQLPDVEVLEFNWIPGLGPDPKVDTYELDSRNVRRAHLAVGILDYPSIGLGFELQIRIQEKLPLFCFVPQGQEVTHLLSCAIIGVRKKILEYGELTQWAGGFPDPMEYANDEEIVGTIHEWVVNYRLKNSKQERWVVQKTAAALSTNI